MDTQGGLENDLAICSLCSGYGGLELGIKRVFPRTKTVCYVEGEAFAVQHLIKKMEEGRLDQAPIWSNLITFDGSKWRGKVDLITGGFPCQPFSYAGSQKGTKDERHLWPEVSRIISEIRPKYIFLENVPGVIKWILPDILKDLSKMGYNASWCVIRASDTSAPHRRSRWFLWAESNSNPNVFRCNENEFDSNERQQSNFIGSCENVSNTHSSTFEKPQRANRKLPKKNTGLLQKENKGEAWSVIRCCCENVIDTNHWEIEPSMGRLVDGSSDWVDKLRLLGNGVVPQQAEYALRILLKNLDSSRS